MLNSFRNFKRVKRFQDRSDVLEFLSLYNSSSTSILDVLEKILFDNSEDHEHFNNGNAVPARSLEMTAAHSLTQCGSDKRKLSYGKKCFSSGTGILINAVSYRYTFECYV